MITISQVKHVSRLFEQLIHSPEFSIIGGYHCVNLGDIALGESVRLLLEFNKFRGGLQTIYNLDRWPWPKTKYNIVGGGAVGYNSSLSKVLGKVKNNFDTLAFLGVDFNEDFYEEEIIAMLQKSAWVSCRNEQQAKKMMLLTDRTDIVSHPDLAFSFMPEMCSKIRHNKNRDKVLLVNIVPLYSTIINGKFVPYTAYKNERPELYNDFNLLIESYKKGVRLVVETALDEGYKIETIPFTPEDVNAGYILLEGLPIKHNSYSSNVLEMIRKIGRCQKVFATRYHATIFSIKTGTELIPMAYADKNVQLLLELGVDKKKILSSKELIEGISCFPDAIMICDKVVSKWELLAVNNINNCIEKIL